MKRDFNRKLVLEDGEEYYGYGFGADVESIAEIIFNTSMVGYQDIVSDPSYTYQMVVMTYPLIGNYGVIDEDFESKQPTIGGLIVREYNDSPSNYRCTKTLSEVLEDSNIPGIFGVDTRKLTRSIRNKGARKALITNANTSLEKALDKIKNYDIPKDAVTIVSCKRKWYSKTAHPIYNVVAIDCGIKLNAIKNLNKKRCNVTIVPYNTTIEEIEKLKPDGVFISNGPCDPKEVKSTIDLVKKLRGKYPIFGIGLGQGIIGLAYGAKTYKLKFGHRGANHPVKNLKNETIEITSQNHSYAIDKESIKETGLEASYVNLLDNAVEGVECKKDKVFAVDYYPESANGPQDTQGLFDRFIENMERSKKNA